MPAVMQAQAQVQAQVQVCRQPTPRCPNRTPRRRLQRIAEIDPDAAYEMMVTTRNDQEFMSGQYDRRTTAGDPGRPANFTGGQLATAFEKAVELLRGKKDQPAESEPAK